MSFIDSENLVQYQTKASLSRITQILKDRGYKIVQTECQIVASKNMFWTSRSSTITVVDNGNVRICYDKETAKGYMNKPKSGVLIKIIQEAEEEIKGE